MACKQKKQRSPLDMPCCCLLPYDPEFLSSFPYGCVFWLENQVHNLQQLITIKVNKVTVSNKRRKYALCVWDGVKWRHAA
jgi:hypothetical protein